MSTTFGIIGGGKMAEAILRALLAKGALDRDDALIGEIDEQRGAWLKRELGVAVTLKPQAVMKGCDTVMLAVKPQDLDALLDMIGGDAAGHLMISIAAGKKLASIEGRLPGARVVRVMPNLAALEAASMNVFCMGQGVTAADRERVTAMLATCGEVLELPEEKFDAVTALSGSGPAFIAYFLQGLIEAGRRAGLGADEAAVLAVQTLRGTAALLASGRFTPETLIAAVSSKKGTTVAGLEVLAQTSLHEDLVHTLRAAADRSRELSQ